MSAHRAKFDAALKRGQAAAQRAFTDASSDVERAALKLWQRSRHDDALREDVLKGGCVLLSRDALARSLIPLPPGRGSVSPIDDDPVLAAFIDQHLGREPLVALAARCRNQFGPERAPSKSAIHRYWHRRAAMQPPQPARR